MWSDAARTASISVRGGANVAAQGAATQASFQAAAGASPYGGRRMSKGKSGAGGGALMNQSGKGMPTGGSSNIPAHGNGVAAIAPSMNSQPSQPARGSETQQTDRNAMDNLVARNYANATMVGDHTTPQALQKYL